MNRGARLTLLDGEIAKSQGHGVPGEDVVAAEDMLPVDGEASAGDDGQHPLHVHHGGCLVPRRLRHASVGLVGLGQHCHAHGEGSVVVEKTKDQPDAAEDDGAVGVHEDDEDGREGVQHEQDL